MGRKNLFINVYVYVYVMSKLVNISDEIYERLTALKKIKNESYTHIIADLLGRTESKKYTLADILNELRTQDKSFKGRKEKIDHDLVAYGVSRESS